MTGLPFTLLFALVGAAAGVAQAGLLARAARRGQPSPLLFLTRLLLVGAVLYAAARAGHLVPCAAGWLAGFVVTAAVVRRRLR